MIEYKITSDENTYDIEIKRAMLANNAFICLYEMTQIFRQYMKYEDIDEITYEVVEKMRMEYMEILDDNAINLDYYYS